MHPRDELCMRWRLLVQHRWIKCKALRKWSDKPVSEYFRHFPRENLNAIFGIVRKPIIT